KILENIHSSSAKSNFERWCKKFELNENSFLYLSAIVKNDKVISNIHHVVPKYDVELHDLLLKKFHDQFNHRYYYLTYFALSEKHISIMQVEVQKYVNKCSVCAINSSIKEKTNMKSVISIASWQHVQIDLVNFQDFATINYG
ncbi:15558_t:CDS:1, partial [Cetraspora pellucida]